MTQKSEIVECMMLGEFVDDGSHPPPEGKRLDQPRKPRSLRDLAGCVATEMGVPQFHLGEVVERLAPRIEQRVWEELQDLMDRLGRCYNADLRAAAEQLQVSPGFLIRILIEVASRALRDETFRALLGQLLVPHASGKCIAAVYGNVREVQDILASADETVDGLCLNKLEDYARGIVARHQSAGAPEGAEGLLSRPS